MCQACCCCPVVPVEVERWAGAARGGRPRVPAHRLLPALRPRPRPAVVPPRPPGATCTARWQFAAWQHVCWSGKLAEAGTQTPPPLTWHCLRCMMSTAMLM